MSNEELVYRHQQGDNEALGQLIEKNMGIVYTVVNRYTIAGSPSIDEEDLEQEGVIGLIIACDKHQFDKGAKFSTYAFIWVRQRISRFMHQRSTNEEISLDVPIGEDESLTLGDLIEDETDYINDSMLRVELDHAMGKYLNVEERRALKLRYGWYNHERTTEEVALLCGKTKGAVITHISTGRGKLYNSPWGREERECRKQRNNITGNYNIDMMLKNLDRDMKASKTNAIG